MWGSYQDPSQLKTFWSVPLKSAASKDFEVYRTMSMTASPSVLRVVANMMAPSREQLLGANPTDEVPSMKLRLAAGIL